MGVVIGSLGQKGIANNTNNNELYSCVKIFSITTNWALSRAINIF
jgi:hypothetical protein